MTRASLLEMLELVAKRGYRDGYDQQQPLSRLRVAKQFIGPVFGKEDADCLIAVYRLGISVGDEQRFEDIAKEQAVGMEDPIHLPDQLFRPRPSLPAPPAPPQRNGE